jgi:HK97 family phage major capsid protein
MSEYTPEQVENLTSAIAKLAATRQEAQPGAPDAEGGRYAAALDGSKEIADHLAKADMEKEDAQRAAFKAEVAEQVKAVLSSIRTPSMAAAIGSGSAAKARSVHESLIDAHPLVKAAYEAAGGSFAPGQFITAVAAANSRDADDQLVGKGVLKGLGAHREGTPESSSSYSYVDAEGKATLGATGATGGFVLPNNLVADLIKPSTQRAVYQNLVTVRPGVAVRGVDQPYRTGAPARATFQDWGQTKENVNEAYASYTANLGTIARIYDVGKQYLRFSAGSAEQDVLDELTKGIILGENFYIIAGAGTGSVGSGDPTTGVYTALNARPNFKSAFASASTTTVAGSFAAACNTIMQNVAAQNREVSAIVVDHVTYFTGAREGADAAGFWVNPAGGPTGFNLLPSGQLAWWTVPIYYDTNLGTNATTKIAIGAQWDVFKLFRGMEFRVDSSDQAGTRWDVNVVGYRGEEEIGFHAGPGVEVGAAYLLTSVIP